MKSLIFTFTLFILIASGVFSQELKFSDLSTASIWNSYTSYVSSDGTIYKIGDKIRIGVPSAGQTFTFITEGGGLMDIKNLSSASSGQESEIIKFFVTGSKRTGFAVTFRTKGTTAFSNYSIQYENALVTGEVHSSGLSSDDALRELKKAKDKLDLELISQVEYDSLKVVYKKYIK